MPTRARSHVLEEESIRRFGDALPSGWVYRSKAPDYGIDGEVEIFNPDGSSTGLSFNVQLRATDDATRIDSVRLEVDELDYYRSLDIPTAVVRYGSPNGSLFWQWASKISFRVDIAEGQRTVTYRFEESERWIDTTSAEIHRYLKVRRRLAHYPSGLAVPIRIDLSAIPAADRYPLDRAMARMIADSRGVLVRAGDSVADVEAFARLEPSFLTVGIEALPGVTFDFPAPSSDDYLSSILYALVRLFRRERLSRHAEELASIIAENRLTHHSPELALDACLALTRNLTALVRIAIDNGLHNEGPTHALIAMTIAKAPHSEKARRLAMDTFFGASLAAASEISPTSEAAAHYSIANFYRHQSDRALAVRHYNRARHLRPAYLQAEYFLSELAGVLFLGGHHKLAERFYREADRLTPHDPDLVFRHGDALLFSGAVREAHGRFSWVITQCETPARLREIELKITICEHLFAVSSEAAPRLRAEANLAMRSNGHDSPEHLEHILRSVDALHPLAHFNLGIVREREGEHLTAARHFLTCAVIQPHDGLSPDVPPPMSRAGSPIDAHAWA